MVATKAPEKSGPFLFARDNFRGMTKLTDREKQVVQLLTEGHTYEQIADVLGPTLCARMVQNHVGNIARKSGYTTRKQFEQSLQTAQKV
jgi:DNA-binding NarL/FixJ family response regulator